MRSFAACKLRSLVILKTRRRQTRGRSKARRASSPGAPYFVPRLFRFHGLRRFRDKTRPSRAQKSTYIDIRGCGKGERTLYKPQNVLPAVSKVYISRFSCTKLPHFVTVGAGSAARWAGFSNECGKIFRVLHLPMDLAARPMQVWKRSLRYAAFGGLMKKETCLLYTSDAADE